jgi:hypothetical protein
MVYNGDDVIKLFEESLGDAKVKLSGLKVAEHAKPPSVNGLNGWVCEQTIRSCLCAELKAAGLLLDVTEQHTIVGRARLDLLAGKVAIEVKAHGEFGANDCGKYNKYRAIIEKTGKCYVYVTLWEGHRPSRETIRKIFGLENSFFVEDPGEWKRFVNAVVGRNS